MCAPYNGTTVIFLQFFVRQIESFGFTNSVRSGGLSVGHSTKPDILERYADVFADTVGNLTGTVHLETDPTVRPVIMPARKLPLAVEQPVKGELAKLVSTDILEPVDKPTTWVSQMAVPVKPSGKIRICLDPHGLNTALMREHYTLPTLDAMLHKLRGAKVFSKGQRPIYTMLSGT